MTTEECTAEISYLKEKIEQLELDIMLLKVSIINNAVPQPIQPYQPWVSPQPYWQNPIITYCGNRT